IAVIREQIVGEGVRSQPHLVNEFVDHHVVDGSHELVTQGAPEQLGLASLDDPLDREIHDRKTEGAEHVSTVVSVAEIASVIPSSEGASIDSLTRGVRLWSEVV